MKKIRIITDSVSDIPANLLEKYNIGVIPCYVNYDGGSYADDGVELDRNAFFDALPDLDTFPTTAAPPPALAEEMLKDFIEGYDHVISINVPAKLSATYNNVKIGAQSLPADQVTVIDSQTLTMAAGFQVLIACEVAEKTGDVNAVMDAVDRVRRNQKLYAAFTTMEYLRRSGRVNTLVAAVGSLLQIKPIVDVYDGEVHPAARVRTFKKAVARMEEFVREQAPLDRIGILHIQNLEGAEELRDRLSDILPDNVLIAEVGPTLGTHIGPGALAVTTLRKSWDE